MNFPFEGMITLGIQLSSVYQKNLLCILSINRPFLLKVQFKQLVSKDTSDTKRFTK